MTKVSVDGTERRAKRALRHVWIAIIHVTGLLKRRRSVADCLEKPSFPCKEGKYQKNCDKDVQSLSYHCFQNNIPFFGLSTKKIKIIKKILDKLSLLLDSEFTTEDSGF